MGFLDDLELLSRHAPGDARNALRQMLGNMPISKALRGENSGRGLDEALMAMPAFDAEQGAQDAYSAGAMLLGVGPGGAVVNTNQKMVDTAKKHFGKTYSPSEAGYMTPAGEMLDMSGRHYGPKVKPGERDWYRGQRQVDHRELGDAVEALLPGDRGPGGTEAMRAFMNEANMVRMQPNVGFETTFVPTKNQLAALERVWGYAKDPLMVDVAHPKTGNTIGSFEMANPTAKQIEARIKQILADYAP